MLPLWNFFLNRRQLTYVIISLLIIAGVFALYKIPKENSPSIDIAQGVVSVFLPGASPEDMESLVTNKLENQISGISNIEELTSVSGEGSSQVIVQFNSSADTDKSIQELRDAVARAVPNLPVDATSPIVSKVDIADQPVLVVSVSGNLQPTEFSELGDRLTEDLLSVNGVSKVTVAGIPKRQVDVIVRKESLEQYGLRISDVIGSISSSNTSLPAGKIVINNVNYNVNFKGAITDPDEIKDIVVGSKSGVSIYLRDIAEVRYGLAPASNYSRVSINGKPSNKAITLQVYKQSDSDIKTVADNVREKIEELKNTRLNELDVFIPVSTDQGIQIQEQLGSLTETGLVTVVLVILVLFLTIGWREAVVAALSIPLSFLIAFIGLYFTGNTLNFISLFALILAVGILVDSGIVVTEAIHARMKDNKSAVDAAKMALREYAWPLIAGTMATVGVFLPLLFISGIVGKYIAGIPYTLIFVLIASIFVALGMVPLIAVLFTGKKQNKFEKKLEDYTEKTTVWCKSKLRILLENRKLQKKFYYLLGILMVLSILLPITGIVPVAFFPQDDQDFIYLNIKSAEGTTLTKTDLVVREVEEILYKFTEAESFQTTVGQSSFLTGFGKTGPNHANITVNLHEDRDKTSSEISEVLARELNQIKSGEVQVMQAINGPPSGAPIQIQFKGDNKKTLIESAEKGRQILSTVDGAKNITSSTQDNGTEFNLYIDRAKAASMGLNTQIIAQTLRSAITGIKSTSIIKGDQSIDVIVKINLNPNYINNTDTNITTLDTIKNLSIQGPNGSVLLGSVLNDSLDISNSSITHKDKTRIETISAFPTDNSSVSEVVDDFKKKLIDYDLPEDVSVSYGGESESINKSFTEMFISLLAGLAIMFIVLVISFDSIKHTLYLLSIVPLSLIGVLVGLGLTGQSLSFTSLLGVIGLGGIIINHAIILMDSLLKDTKDHPEKNMIDIVLDSSEKRFRPIVLTTIATVIGMIPLSQTNPTWGPFAFTIMFGLTFALSLTLILVPVFYFNSMKRHRA